MAVGQTRRFIRIHQHRRKTRHFRAPQLVVDHHRRYQRFNGSHQPGIRQITSSQPPSVAQATLLDALAVDISTMLGISTWEEGVVLGEFRLAYGRWCVDYAVVQKFLQGLGMHTRYTLDELDVDTTEKVLESIGKLGVGIVEGIVNIQAERNKQNHPDSDLPHVLPHELVKMSTGDFGKNIVDIHLQQLRAFVGRGIYRRD